MKLTLIVVEAPEHSNMSNHTKVFEKSGTIGRSEKSTWVLPDTKRVLSSSHLQISVDRNQCTVTDTSTNGSSLNEPTNLLSKQKPHPLQNGDIIIVGEYKLKAVLEASQEVPPASSSGSVLDDYDKTTFATSESASRSQLEKNAANLDQFIDSPTPQSPINNNQGGWAKDFGSGDANLGEISNTDPLKSQQTNQSSPSFGFNSNNSDSFGSTDGLGLNNPSSGFESQSNSWDQKEDWWNDNGSSSDHSPIINERIDKFKPEQEPEFANQNSSSVDQFDHLFVDTPATPQTQQPEQTPSPNNWGSDNNASEQQSFDSGLGIDEGTPGFVPSTEPSNKHQAFGFSSEQLDSNEATTNSPPPMQSEQNLNPPAPQQSPPEQDWFGATGNSPQKPQRNNENYAAQIVGQQPTRTPASMDYGTPPIQESRPQPQVNAENHVPYSNHQQNTTRNENNMDPVYGAPDQNQSQWNTTSPPQNLRTHATPEQPEVSQNGAKQLAESLTLEWSNVTRPDDLLSDSAAMITETVRRLMDLLRARSAVKNELRVERTMIETVNNNPLKFTTDTSDALNIIFEKQGRSYMSPKETIEDSFDDLSDHQIAVLSGMQSAYDAMFRYFHPDNLEKRFKNKNNLFTNKNAMNWESFVSHYEELVSEKEQTYARIFGEHFSAAYEKQLSELKSARSFTNNNRNT